MRQSRSAVVALLCFAAVAAAIAQAAVDRQSPPAPTPAHSAPESGGMAGEAAAVSDPAAGVPDLPENRAEIEALRKGEMRPAPATKSDSADPVTAEVTAARRAVYEQVLREQDALIEALRPRLEAARGTAGALELQREIEKVKAQTERRLLEAQARIAREEGRPEQVAAIEAALAELDAPRPLLPPAARPTPTASQR